MTMTTTSSLSAAATIAHQNREMKKKKKKNFSVWSYCVTIIRVVKFFEGYMPNKRSRTRERYLCVHAVPFLLWIDYYTLKNRHLFFKVSYDAFVYFPFTFFFVAFLAFRRLCSSPFLLLLVFSQLHFIYFSACMEFLLKTLFVVVAVFVDSIFCVIIYTHGKHYENIEIGTERNGSNVWRSVYTYIKIMFAYATIVLKINRNSDEERKMKWKKDDS